VKNTNPNGDEMMIMRKMWQVFSIQRVPVERMKEMITDME
jgi:hypothetical protein